MIGLVTTVPTHPAWAREREARRAAAKRRAAELRAQVKAEIEGRGRPLSPDHQTMLAGVAQRSGGAVAIGMSNAAIARHLGTRE